MKIATPGVNGLYVLTNTDMPAVLVELAFISNADDVVLLTEKQDEFARAIARGITDYLKDTSANFIALSLKNGTLILQENLEIT